jgi:hypothetical protein
MVRPYEDASADVGLTHNSLHNYRLGAVSQYTSLSHRWLRDRLHRRARVGNLARALWLLFTRKLNSPFF